MSVYVSGYRSADESITTFTLYRSPRTYCDVTVTKTGEGLKIVVNLCVIDLKRSPELENALRRAIETYPYPYEPTFTDLKDILSNLFERVISNFV